MPKRRIFSHSVVREISSRRAASDNWPAVSVKTRSISRFSAASRTAASERPYRQRAPGGHASSPETSPSASARDPRLRRRRARRDCAVRARCRARVRQRRLFREGAYASHRSLSLLRSSLEVAGQQPDNILRSLPQRWHLYRHRVDPIKQILAKAPSPESGRSNRRWWRTDNSCVEGNAGFSADAMKAPLLKNP